MKFSWFISHNGEQGLLARYIHISGLPFCFDVITILQRVQGSSFDGGAWISYRTIFFLRAVAVPLIIVTM